MPQVYPKIKKKEEVYPSPALFGKKNHQESDPTNGNDDDEEGDQTHVEEDTPATDPALLAQKLAKHALHPMTSEELYEIRPPANIYNWILPHVERWVLFVIQFPQYAEKFREKGIDGPALLKITDEYLQDNMGVDDSMQIERFRRHIMKLQEQQQRILEDLAWAERYDKGLLVSKTVKLKKPKVLTKPPSTKAENALFFTGKHAAIYIIRNNSNNNNNASSETNKSAVENERKEIQDEVQDQEDGQERDQEENKIEENDHTQEPLLITEETSSSGKLPVIKQQQQQPTENTPAGSMLVVGANAQPFLLSATATIFLVSSDQPVSRATAKQIHHSIKTTTTTKQLLHKKQRQKQQRDNKGSDQQKLLQSLPNGTDGIVITGGVSVQRLLPDMSPWPSSKQKNNNHHKITSKSQQYQGQQAMLQDLPREADEQEEEEEGLPRPMHLRRMLVVPSDYSTFEVLELLRGRLYSVSQWLLERHQQRELLRELEDDDLASPRSRRRYQDYCLYDDINNQGEEGNDEAEGPVPEYTIEDTNPPLPEYSGEDGEGDGGDDDALGDAPDYALSMQHPVVSPSSSPSRTSPGGGASRTGAKATCGSLHRGDLDRISLLFHAFCSKSHAVTSYSRPQLALTLYKISICFHKVLRIRMDNLQFDAVWKVLDANNLRLSSIDIHQFRSMFNSILEEAEVEAGAGMGTYDATGRSFGVEGLTRLTIPPVEGGVGGRRAKSANGGIESTATTTRAFGKFLRDLCDALRHTNMSVREIFRGFDRDASGFISISEFSSMLRTLVGTSVDRRLIYKAINLMDNEGSGGSGSGQGHDRKISQQELMMFIYHTWKTQLMELDNRIATYDEAGMNDHPKRMKLVRERRHLEQAIKNNFSDRQWRERAEERVNRMKAPGQGLGKKQGLGPFTALYQAMNDGSGGGIEGDGGGNKRMDAWH